MCQHDASRDPAALEACAAMLPQPALDLLTRAAGVPSELAPTFGGFSHHSALATIDGRRCVVKAAEAVPKRADLRHEARVLVLLRGSGLPAPVLIALAEDAGWTVEVLEFMPGANGLHILAQAPAELGQVYDTLGRALAAVHHSGLAPPAHDLLLAERARRLRAALADLPLDDDLCAALAQALEQPAWRSPNVCLVHGDAGIHNLLWEGRITALLDWEWAGWGDPLIDLAWVWWTMRWRDLPSRLWAVFLAGYAADRRAQIAAEPAVLRALALGQIAGILARAQGQPGAWAEWLRRARWTLELEVGQF
jgi:aminoglycoside phosphotransferase (APT) family kinase protein